MNNHSVKFTFTGKLQFFIRHGEAIWIEEKRYYHVDLSVAEKMKYGSIVSCSCVIKKKLFRCNLLHPEIYRQVLLKVSFLRTEI